MDLAGKNVLITGSTRGIGLAIAKAFDEAGARVILHGRSAVKPEVMAEFSEDTLAITADIADENSVNDALAGLLEEVDGIDILVNNAGIVDDKLAMGMKPSEFANVVNTNLNGTFNVTQPLFRRCCAPVQETSLTSHQWWD